MQYKEERRVDQNPVTNYWRKMSKNVNETATGIYL
jgi:hypothetical protein